MAAREKPERAERPEKIPFSPEFTEQAAKLARTFPVTDKGFARYFGVPRGTVRQWRREFPEFDAACRLTEETAIPGIVDTVLQAALDGNLTAAQFVLSRRAGWLEKQSIGLNVTKSIAEMSDEELMQIVAASRAEPSADGDRTTH